MDFYCIERLFDLPEFRVIRIALESHQLDLYLQRRACSIVCPYCQGVCDRVKESRTRCIRDLPILDRPVM